jgi:hypothetical protein
LRNGFPIFLLRSITRRSFGDLRVRTYLFLTSHNPVSRYSTVLLLQAELSRIKVGLRRWLSSPGEVPRRVPIAEYVLLLHVESVAVINQRVARLKISNRTGIVT